MRPLMHLRTSISMAICILPLAFLSAAGAEVPAAATVSDGVVNTDVYPEHNVSFPGGVTGIPDLTYYSVSGYRAMRMDLYLPPASFDTPRPFIVYTHGGGWSGGNKRTTGAFSNWPGVLASLAAKGYVVASLDYRLSSDETFPAAIQDVKAAIRFLRANADKYNIDKTRALTWGPSAGGQLSALAGTSCGAANLSPPARAGRGGRGGPATVETAAPAPTGMDAESDCVQAAIGWYGIYDFATMRRPAQPGAAPSADNVYLGCGSTPCSQQQLDAASPQFYISDKTPPFLIVHGMKDTTVPVAQAQNFFAALKAKGIKADMLLLPDVGHSFIGETPKATHDASIEALERTIAFIDATIGDKKQK